VKIKSGQNSSYQINERADAIVITLDENSLVPSATWQLDIYANLNVGKAYLGTLNTVAAVDTPLAPARVIGYAVCPGARAWMIESFGISPGGDGVDLETSAQLRAAPVDPAAFGLAPGVYRPQRPVIWNGTLATALGKDSTAPLASSRVDFTAPISLVGAFGSNETLVTIWIMFFDATAVPANGTQPVNGLSFNVPPGGSFNWVAPAPGVFLRTGMVWAASSTANTLTAIAPGPTARVVTMANW
jgi:hypothetical protein